MSRLRCLVLAFMIARPLPVRQLPRRPILVIRCVQARSRLVSCILLSYFGPSIRLESTYAVEPQLGS